MPCQAPAETTKAMKHFRKQNKIHAGQTTVSHNQHDTLSNKHNINVKLRFIVCKNHDKLLATHITHQEKQSIKMLPTNRDTQSMTYIKTIKPQSMQQHTQKIVVYLVHNPCQTSSKPFSIPTTNATPEVPNAIHMPQQRPQNPCKTRKMHNPWHHFTIHATQGDHDEQSTTQINQTTSQSMQQHSKKTWKPIHDLHQATNQINATTRNTATEKTWYAIHDTHTHTKRQITIHVTTWQPRNHDKQSMTYTKQQITIHDAHQATYHNACNNMAAKKPG